MPLEVNICLMLCLYNALELLHNGEGRYIKSKVGRQSPCSGNHDPTVVVNNLQNKDNVGLGHCASRQVKKCGLPIDLYVRFN